MRLAISLALAALPTVACYRATPVTEAPTLEGATQLDAAPDLVFAAPLRDVLRNVRGRAGTTFCVALRQRASALISGDPSSALLRDLGERRHVVPMSACPPTDLTGTPRRQADGRLLEQPAAGHTNPLRVTVLDDEPDSLRVGVVRIEILEGTLGMRHRCVHHAPEWRCRHSEELPRIAPRVPAA